jgi:hypothetical protein
VTREVFVAGQILTAAEMNVVSDQTVMSFAGTAARGSAIPSPVEGMTTFLEDSNILSIYDGSNWKNSLGVTGGVLQVVQTLKTDVFTTTSATFTSVTGASVSITPRATSSRILILGTTFVGVSTSTNSRSAFVRLSGGNSATYIGDTAGNRVPALGSPGSRANDLGIPSANGFTSLAYVDSPATTSAVTYQLEMRVTNAADTGTIGRTGTDTDNASFGRFPTTLIALEVAG